MGRLNTEFPTCTKPSNVRPNFKIKTFIMATTTATIFVGHSHQNGGGINPTHLIQFTENDRPALILSDMDGKNERNVIIPTVENM